MKIGLFGDWGEVAALSQMLTGAGQSCVNFREEDSVKRYLNRDTLDLFMLHWDRASASGLEIICWLKGRIEALPVLMLGDRSGSQDIVAAIEAGADGYIVKPVEHAVLLARIAAFDRGMSPHNRVAFTNGEDYGRFHFDLGERSLFLNGARRELTVREYELALTLFRNRGRMLSRAYLYERLWGNRADLQTRTLDVHVSKLRTKAGLAPVNGCRLSTIYGFGYRLDCA